MLHRQSHCTLPDYLVCNWCNICIIENQKRRDQMVTTVSFLSICNLLQKQCADLRPKPVRASTVAWLPTVWSVVLRSGWACWQSLLKLLRAATQHLICQHTVAEPERKPNLPKFESVIQFNLDLPNLLFYLQPCKSQVRTLTGIPALYLIFQQYQCLPCNSTASSWTWFWSLVCFKP